MTFLLDTNVISELRKEAAGRAEPLVVAWARGEAAQTLFLSAMTIYEIETGILRLERRDRAQANVLRPWLANLVNVAFAGRILPVDAAVARRAAALQVPDPKPLADALIAATALVHGLTVATRNTADFAACGAPTVNPWGAG